MRAFGVVGGAAAGASLAANVSPIGGAVVGSIVGDVLQDAVKHFFDIGAELGDEWKPVVFGNWYKGYIEKLLEKPTQDYPDRL